MSSRTRLDTELVRRGLVRSRAEAQRAIESGVVQVAGNPAVKAATLVDRQVPITLASPPSRFVSRGGDKLDGALERLPVRVEGRRWLDAGASTGGFTDRLLQGGAVAVAAVDVGYGQLDWKLRNDARVIVFERTNVRTMTAEDLPWTPDGIVADLSFISLATVLPAFDALIASDGDMLIMVKPQFEVGKEGLGKGGVVRDPLRWESSLSKITAAAGEIGWKLAGATYSEPPGPSGNREFFIHLRQDGDVDEQVLTRAVEDAP